MRFIQLIAFMLSAFASLAQESPIHVVLNSRDAQNLFDSMKHVTKVEWFKKLHHQNLVDVRKDIKIFQTSDASIVITCSAELFLGVMGNHSCVVSFDTSKSNSENIIEERAWGVFHGFIHNSSDAIRLFEDILMPHPRFASLEKVAVQKNDGSSIEWFRLIITCFHVNDGPFLTYPRSCTISGISLPPSL